MHPQRAAPLPRDFTALRHCSLAAARFAAQRAMAADTREHFRQPPATRMSLSRAKSASLSPSRNDARNHAKFTILNGRRAERVPGSSRRSRLVATSLVRAATAGPRRAAALAPKRRAGRGAQGGASVAGGASVGGSESSGGSSSVGGSPSSGGAGSPGIAGSAAGSASGGAASGAVRRAALPAQEARAALRQAAAGRARAAATERGRRNERGRRHERRLHRIRSVSGNRRLQSAPARRLDHVRHAHEQRRLPRPAVHESQSRQLAPHLRRQPIEWPRHGRRRALPQGQRGLSRHQDRGTSTRST